MMAKRWSKGCVAAMALTAGVGCSADDDAGGADAGGAPVDEVRVGTACMDGAGRMVLTMQLMDETPERTFAVGRTDPAAVGLAEDGKVSATVADFSLASSRLEALAEPGTPKDLAISVRELNYVATARGARADDDRLVVLVVDNSAGTDPTDARIDLLKAIVRRPEIPRDTYFSLVWFNGGQPTIAPEFGTPTRNLDMLVCPSGDDGDNCRNDAEMDGLAKLSVHEAAGTPLTDALERVYEIIVDGPKLQDLNPIVVLVTDGVEDGDTSGSGATLESVSAQYAGRTFDGEPFPVPVIVVHLQPPAGSGSPQGPDSGLHALACATGGEYYFVSDAAWLSDPSGLAAQVAGGLTGTWRLGIDADPAPAEPAWLETELTATVAGSTLTANPRLFASP